MRCQEVRRRLAELSLHGDPYVWDTNIRAHVAGCPACAQHVQAQEELSSALRGTGVPDQTGGVPLSAVRSLVEERVAQIQNENRWSTIMSRIARSFARPAYMIPSVVAVVAVLALTLFPWKADQPGSYRVAFAGVDKDLALQEFGVQRVLNRLGIADASVVVGDCESSCNLTIGDLRDVNEVGKVVSVMLQLSDCQLLDVECNVDIDINIPGKKVITCDSDGIVTCDFVNELSDADMEKIQLVVSEVRLGDCVVSDGGAENGQSIQVMALKDCPIPCNPVQNIKGWSDEAAARGDTLKLTFDICGGVPLAEIREDDEQFDTQSPDPMSEPLTKTGASSAPINGFQLNQNYPNPFNGSTTITFRAPEGGGTATLEVYNIRGQLVKTLVDENVSAGTHEFTWDATDSEGHRVASGIYLYRLRAGEYVETKEMALLK